MNPKTLLSIWHESDGSWSFARIQCTLTTLVSCGVLIFLVVQNHSLPGAGELGALAGFAGGTYAINKIGTAFGKGENL